MGSVVTSLSISIPAYNEAAALPQVLQEAVQTLEELRLDGEILLIDDGSTDATPQISKEWAGRDPRIRVIRHEKNLGFGTTLKDVFQLPTKDWIFFAPGDGQIPIGEVKQLLPHTTKSRFILGWRKNRADPWARKLQAWIYNRIISILMGRRVHDVDSVVLIQRHLAQKLPLSSQSVFLHAELALGAAQSGTNILEVPIRHRPRTGGRPRGAKFSTILRTLKDLGSHILTAHSK